VRVLINAVSIREGGSQVVFQKLLDEWLAEGADCVFMPIVNRHLYDGLPAGEQVQPVLVEDRLDSPARIRCWYETALPRLAAENRADVLFSQTNYLPSRRLPCPSLLLVQHAGHFSRQFGQLMDAHAHGPMARLGWRLKGSWVRRSLLRASVVTVQTAALADEIARQTSFPRDRISVVPHGPGLVVHGRPKPYPESRPWRIGCITKFGVQKNFQTAFRAIAELRKSQPVRLVTSLDETIPEYAGVRRQIDQAGIADLVDNRGETRPEELQGVYDSLDLFVFPSLCESFGFPLVEAMARGLPVVAADTAGTREVGGAAPVLFEPSDARGLAHALHRLMTEPDLYALCASKAAQAAGSYTWQRAASETMRLLHRTADRDAGIVREGAIADAGR